MPLPAFGPVLASFLIGLAVGAGFFLMYSAGESIAKQVREADTEDLIAFVAMVVILGRTVVLGDEHWVEAVGNGNFTWLVASIILAIGGAKVGRKFNSRSS